MKFYVATQVIGEDVIAVRGFSEAEMFYIDAEWEPLESDLLVAEDDTIRNFSETGITLFHSRGAYSKKVVDGELVSRDLDEMYDIEEEIEKVVEKITNERNQLLEPTDQTILLYQEIVIATSLQLEGREDQMASNTFADAYNARKAIRASANNFIDTVSDMESLNDVWDYTWDFSDEEEEEP